jgi:hypothetical protein
MAVVLVQFSWVIQLKRNTSAGNRAASPIVRRRFTTVHYLLYATNRAAGKAQMRGNARKLNTYAAGKRGFQVCYNGHRVEPGLRHELPGKISAALLVPGISLGHERLELVPRAKGGKVGMRRNSHSLFSLPSSARRAHPGSNAERRKLLRRAVGLRTTDPVSRPVARGC